VIARARRHRSRADEVDPFALHVFIPGALASGFLVSIGLLVGDAMRRVRGDGATRRRVTVTGAALADEVRRGSGAAQATAVGLRPRRVYGIVGALALALVVGVVPGASWNFLAPGGYISDIAWIWALSMMAVLAILVVTVQALRLAPEWVPVAVALVGAGVVARFALGPEAGNVRLGAVAGAAVVTPLAVLATWHLRRRLGRIYVPASVRPLLAGTPLGAERITAVDSEA
jgi:hypothetical protein